MALSTNVIKLMEQIANKLEEWLKPHPDEKILTRHKYTAPAGYVFSLDEPFEGFDKILDELRLNGQKQPYELLKGKYDTLSQSAQKTDQEKRKYDEHRKVGLQARDAQDVEEFFAIGAMKSQAAQLAETLRSIAQQAGEELTTQKPIEAEQNATSSKRKKENWFWKLYEKTVKAIFGAVLDKFSG